MSTVSIVDFEQINVYRVASNSENLYMTTTDKTSRSSHQRCSMKKGVLRKFAKLTGKHLCQSLFFNKVAGLRPATLSKKRPWHRCFPVNFAKFLRTPFFHNTSGRLLLDIDVFITDTYL